MTKRHLSVAPLSSRKRQAPTTPSSEESISSSESDHTPGVLALILSSSRSPSPTQVDFDTRPRIVERTSNGNCATQLSSLSSSAPTPIPVLVTKTPEESNSMLALPSSTTIMATKVGPAGLLTPEHWAPSHDGTVSLPTQRRSFQPSEANALIHFQTPDAFPVFRSGDVVIKSVLGPTPITFQLHSDVLGRHSPWFNKAFQPTDIGAQVPSSWSFSIEDVNGKVGLVQHHTNGNCPAILPVSQEPVIKTEEMIDDSLSIKSNIESPETESAAVAVRQRKDSVMIGFYSQVFGAFYNIALSISTNDIRSTLVQSEELVKISGNLGCLHLLRPHLGNVFSQYRQNLFISIKSDPPRWILLAMALENPSIYEECLIHLVGAHPTWPWSIKRMVLPPELRQLIIQKSADLDRLCTEAERDLFIATIRVGKDPVSPHERGNIDTWMVVQVFRDALARHFHSLGNSISKKVKNRGTFFRGLHKGSYMDAEDVRNMCQEIMNSSWKDLGDDLKALKTYAADTVEKLAENQLMIDPDAHGVGYLTCTKIEPKDFLWRTDGQSAI